MRTTFSPILVALALTASAASAADISKAPSFNDRYQPAVINWDGMYIGVAGGWGAGSIVSEPSYGLDPIKTSGWLAGGAVGFNRQFGNVIVGLEASAYRTSLNGDRSRAYSYSYYDCSWWSCDERSYTATTRDTTELQWLGMANLRFGYAVGRLLPYITGGAAFGTIRQEYAYSDSWGSTYKSNAFVNGIGYNVGVGLEWAIDQHWSVFGEYRHVDLGVNRYSDHWNNQATRFAADIGLAGLNLRF